MRKTIILIALLMLTAASAFAEGGGDITFQLSKSEPVHFSHDYHIKSRGVKCAACHFQGFAAETGSFQIKKEKLNKRDFCGHCHNGMKGFDVASTKNCARCHKK